MFEIFRTENRAEKMNQADIMTYRTKIMSMLESTDNVYHIAFVSYLGGSKSVFDCLCIRNCKVEYYPFSYWIVINKQNDPKLRRQPMMNM